MIHDDHIHQLYAPRWVSHDQSPKELYSQILPGLWMGGTADGDTIDRAQSRTGFSNDSPAFDAVATLYAWARPMSWNVAEYRYGFGDGSIEHVDLVRLLDVAVWAHNCWKSGDKVLVRCQAGLNRSGLVTALVLMLDGYSARDAIASIRCGRAPVALVNDAFVEWLDGHAAAFIAASVTPASSVAS